MYVVQVVNIVKEQFSARACLQIHLHSTAAASFLTRQLYELPFISYKGCGDPAHFDTIV